MVAVKREVLEDFALIGGLVGVQCVYAGNSVLLSYLMSIGITPLSLVMFSAFATFLVLSPFSIYFERSKWPKKFTLRLIIQLILISFAGVTLFQSLFMKGIELTSPAIATAMPNLAPGLIFLIAWTFRLERVKLSCLYSKVKIAGTLLCVVGALMMSVFNSASAKQADQLLTPPSEGVFDKEKILGCIYLLAAVIVLSSNVVLQAVTLGDFPAPISMCAITSLIGVVITAFVQLIQEHKLIMSWPLVSIRDIVGYSLLFLTVVISVITLGDSISLGSLAGMCILFTGLYLVLWAKGKEGLMIVEDSFESEFDPEKPLLS
ncbi:hypothetical protein L1049_023182 [Liquidambar formosana]|uniref:WAT1-related protein n=1 Tax=Liquidambar formosana TaxID=63359 RepID=A0AAP0RFQ0_LIQFO